MGQEANGAKRRTWPSSGQRLRGPTLRCTCCRGPTDVGRRWAAAGYPDSGPSIGHLRLLQHRADSTAGGPGVACMQVKLFNKKKY